MLLFITGPNLFWRHHVDVEKMHEHNIRTVRMNWLHLKSPDILKIMFRLSVNVRRLMKSSKIINYNDIWVVNVV